MAPACGWPRHPPPGCAPATGGGLINFQVVVSNMTVVYPCPLCGRSVNRRGVPLDEPGKTKAHIDGSHDEQHSGERGENHMDAIHERSMEMESGEMPVTTESGEEPVREDSEPLEERRVSVGWSAEPVPVSEAVEQVNGVVEDPEAFGFATEEGLAKLRERVGELEADVESVDRVLRVLMAESSVLSVSCPRECPGELVTTGMMNKRVVCDECGHEAGV